MILTIGLKNYLHYVFFWGGPYSSCSLMGTETIKPIPISKAPTLHVSPLVWPPQVGSDSSDRQSAQASVTTKPGHNGPIQALLGWGVVLWCWGWRPQDLDCQLLEISCRAQWRKLPRPWTFIRGLCHDSKGTLLSSTPLRRLASITLLRRRCLAEGVEHRWQNCLWTAGSSKAMHHNAFWTDVKPVGCTHIFWMCTPMYMNACMHVNVHIALHCIALHCIALHYITLHYTTLHYTTLHYITLHYITLHYITLHYITLHYITLHTHTHTCIHAYMHACLHACLHTYICTHIRKYTYMNTHTLAYSG